MEVKLLTSKTSLQEMENIATQAGLICHNNEGRQVDNKDFLTRIIKNKHESVLEHISLSYRIDGISRALLQELTRHRHTSASVESTRHTLRNKLKDTVWFNDLFNSVSDDMKEFLVVFAKFADNHPDMPNDQLKYFIPEFWPVKLILSLNVRELRLILRLRTSPGVLKEFQVLARTLADALPEEFRYLVQDCIHETTAVDGH